MHVPRPWAPPPSRRLGPAAGAVVGGAIGAAAGSGIGAAAAVLKGGAFLLIAVGGGAGHGDPVDWGSLVTSVARLAFRLAVGGAAVGFVAGALLGVTGAAIWRR